MKRAAPHPNRDRAIAILYPGQGTQRIGMAMDLCRNWSSARASFDIASTRFGRDLRELCARGPIATLTATENLQPIVFASGVAASLVVASSDREPSAVAGHSAGEMTALWASGVLSYAEAQRLVALRGRLMADVSRAGSMIAITGLTASQLEECCADARHHGPVVIALHNAPLQLVLSGDTTAVRAAADSAYKRGAQRVVELRTSNAFHSPLMEEAVEPWGKAISGANFRVPSTPLALNTLGRISDDVDEIKDAVTNQLAQPVRWVDCIRSIRALGIDFFIEAGDSKALASFLKSFDEPPEVLSLDDLRAVRRLYEPDPVAFREREVALVS